MLKLEIRLDEEKIQEQGKYTLDFLQKTLIQAFEKYQIDHTITADGTLSFVGSGRARDYGCFGKMITTLKQRKWFMEYVIKWIWYNSDDGEDENDFATEDVLKHYTNRSSEA